jgi:hypothetical protein
MPVALAGVLRKTEARILFNEHLMEEAYRVRRGLPAWRSGMVVASSPHREAG